LAIATDFFIFLFPPSEFDHSSDGGFLSDPVFDDHPSRSFLCLGGFLFFYSRLPFSSASWGRSLSPGFQGNVAIKGGDVKWRIVAADGTNF